MCYLQFKHFRLIINYIHKFIKRLSPVSYKQCLKMLKHKGLLPLGKIK